MAQGNSHPWCQQPEQSLIHESPIFEFYCSPTKLGTFKYLVSKTTWSIVPGHFLGGVVRFWSPGSSQLTSVVRRWDGMESWAFCTCTCRFVLGSNQLTSVVNRWDGMKSWAFSPFVLEQARKTCLWIETAACYRGDDDDFHLRHLTVIEHWCVKRGWVNRGKVADYANASWRNTVKSIPFYHQLQQAL